MAHLVRDDLACVVAPPAAGLMLGGVHRNATQWWYAGFVVDWIALVRPGGFIMVNAADIALVVGYCLALLPFVLTRISTRSPLTEVRLRVGALQGCDGDADGAHGRSLSSGHKHGIADTLAERLPVVCSAR